MKVKAEVVIAELNRLRGDVDKDMTDPEYFALHHALRGRADGADRLYRRGRSERQANQG